MSAIAGVVLGAGLSERMGSQKQLLPYGETTLLGAVVAAAEDSRLDPVVVVVGAAAIEIEASLTLRRAVVVHNFDYHEGTLSSLRAGVAAAGEVAAVMLLLGDMPDVDALLIDQVAAAWEAAPVPLLVTEYQDGIGHPFVLGPRSLAQLSELRGPKPLWELVTGPDVGRARVARNRPVDVDTPADYEALLRGDG